MILSAPLLRRIHKWIGLILGRQFVIWAVSGATMALLDMKTVAGGKAPAAAVTPALPVGDTAWPQVRRSLGGQAITGVAVRPLLDRQIFEVATRASVRLFDARDGGPVRVDGLLARKVAEASYVGRGKVASVAPLRELELAVREHKLPIWRVDFADEANSSFYVSGETGKLLERRNDTWRIWDFAWMLHNMDYVSRTSFNHPLIIFLGFVAVWLAITGVYLLVRTGWRSDFKRLKRRFRRT